MAKIYTKTGDKGTTSLFGGKRVPKNDLRVISYGTVDELTSFIGLAVAKLNQQKTTLSSGSLTNWHSGKETPGPSASSIARSFGPVKSHKKRGVDPGGVEPPPPGLTDLMPHRSGPTQGALSQIKTLQSTEKLLTTIQTDLYEIMAYLANAPMKLESLESHTALFETTIDDITKKLPELRSFILPQGGELASLFHVCRALARRCERNLVAYKRASKSTRQHEKNIVQYLNRLSDLFFTLARQAAEKEIKVKTFGN